MRWLGPDRVSRAVVKGSFLSTPREHTTQTNNSARSEPRATGKEIPNSQNKRSDAARTRGEGTTAATGIPRAVLVQDKEEGEMGLCSCCCRCLELLFSILLPPLGVCLRHGCCSLEFWISVVLTVLGYIPGVLYAIYVILSVDPHRRDRNRDPDDYVYVA